ncbi:unnamed protein product (macronuclear) [Paramecium tetraurelia]|uniref:RING-CH-type domain-containing protein n=1 Tax=Paramecium tetraurelia TaxID=5888 RepID=A0BC78_PARTE|nr:uncharacterized protein GSPATT00004239001 [Paramecium tetraurelia]CAK56145.1 unnamed protein product [Paramecium tetraurelia]|eukprot:XP_001423543.1 hypothetical protein (macronuclear) [Paramecium tetraurelia strain d4-2]
MSDDRHQATTPNTNFVVLNTSDQGISENVILKTQKSRSKILKTVYSRDLIRKKIVGCRIYTNEIVETIQSELKKNCRICIQDEESSQFISPCKCKGSAQFVHEECLKMWILEQFGVNKIYNKNLICEICKHKLDYRVNFVDRFDICQFKKLKRTTKCCWIIQLVFIALCIYASISIISRFGINSLSTISIVVVICLILLVIAVNLCFSVIQAHKVEMIENWQFQNYKPSNRALHGKRQIPSKFLRMNQIHCL